MASYSKGRRRGGRGPLSILIGLVIVGFLVFSVLAPVVRAAGVTKDNFEIVGSSRAISNSFQQCIGQGLSDYWNCAVDKPDTEKAKDFAGNAKDSAGNVAKSAKDKYGELSGGDKNADVAALNQIRTADPTPKDGYDRKQWPTWATVKAPCDVRETVLKEQGKNVKTNPKTCSPVEGTWDDPYTGKTVDKARALDIDHVIPLGYVYTHGGSKFDTAQRKTFANDMSNLLAVDASANRQKSDKGPAEWMPKENKCQYSKLWVSTAKKYDLAISQPDKDVLAKELNKCGK